MAKVLYIWEFGSGLGHLTTALPLAKEYWQRGHQLDFVVKDLVSAQVVIPAGRHRLFQAPVYPLVSPLMGHRPISYAEILLQHGLGDARKLGVLVRAWLDLFEVLKPDLLLLDFSPTANLAARIAGIRRCSIGHGFFSPPQLSPVPPFISAADPRRVATSERLLLEALNHVCAQHGRPVYESFADFFAVELNLLTTWPEIEHYPQRGDVTYWGPVLMRGAGKAPEWAKAAGPKVFVYMRGTDNRLPIVVEAINLLQGSALVYAPNVLAEIVTKLQSDRIHFSASPYDTSAVVASADFVVCHAGFGTVWEAMLAGTPLLCLPSHQEQQIVAERLVNLGIGVMAPHVGSAQAYANEMQKLTTQATYRDAARGVQRKYQDHDVKDQLARLLAATLPASSDEF